MLTKNKKYQDTGVIAWFMNNHVAANILMMLLVIGGILSVQQMRTETFPSIDPKMITVSVSYPGATPYEIEESIISRITQTLTGIEGVDNIRGTAAEGMGAVYIELQDFVDADDVYNDVETAVNSIVDFPPADAERPMVTKMRPTPNIMTLAIHGDVSERAIKYWAEQIEDEIKLLPGIAGTSLRGVRDYEISIEVSENTLRNYDLSLNDIAIAIQNFSVDVPAGSIESKRGDILLRVQQKRYTRSEFENIVVTALSNGTTLLLKDIATVRDGFTDDKIDSRFNGERSAQIDITRSDSADTLGTVKNIRDYLNTNVDLPKGLTLSIQNDETVALSGRISLMVRNGIIGFMLVFVILLLFLDLKLAFWTSIAVPVSFLGGLMVANFYGLSLNMVSVFALIIVLGVVVDDAIIVGESIFEEQRNNPGDEKAVLRGVKNVMGPVTVGVSTTIAAFAPLLFSTGNLGQIIGVIPMVIIPILIISLFEAYFILPSHLSNPRRWSRGIMATIRDKFTSSLVYVTDKFIVPVARFCMTFRYAVMAGFLCFAFVTASMVSSGTVRFIFLPNIEADKVEIKIDLPIGTPYELTKNTMDVIEGHIMDVCHDLEKNGATIFKSFTTNIGQINNQQGGPGGRGGSSLAANRGQFQIQMVPSQFRDVSSRELESMIRARISDLPNIEKMEFQSSIIHDDADIDIYLSHPNDYELNEAAEELKLALKSIKGTKEVADSFEPGKTEYVFDLNVEGIAVGLTPEKLGQELRSAFFGIEVQRFQRGQSEVIAYVRYPNSERKDLSAIENMRIRLNDGREVPLKSVAIIKQQNGYASISTHNGLRYTSVTAKADQAITTPNEIMAILNSKILPDLKVRYPKLQYSYEGESKEQAKDLASLGQNMLVASLFIYVLLGAQLRSYIQPIVVMSAIPFGIVGAIWGHYLLGHDLTFISFFGMVALTGVVVNDSVVLLDYLNQKRADGETAFDAAIHAIKRRFRPILLTTMTTSIGLLPILLEPSVQAQFLVPMVVSLATGIIFATCVILVMVPCLMLVIDDIHSKFKRTEKTI